MKDIKIAKVVVNIGIGNDGEKIEKAYSLLKRLTKREPVKTLATGKAKTFRIRKGLPIGVKITLRNSDATEFLKTVLPAIEHRIINKSFDNEGNFGFGIKEYLDIPSQKYDPQIGTMGMNVLISLERPGYRIKRRKIQKRKIPGNHRIKKEDAIEFAKNELKIEVV